ncbi:hypothetical protein [Rhodococcus sp. RDE2]|uniref:hypothetical protein n=1 Tax=Rhodococcus sp. RDE2 TaxID=2885078 RepID=UPI001E527D0D|nr:hypothetical protein [Rhodococcus sp. RDE2]BDB62348.1 hypothetical protein RDE2_41420 [Rhodococcus sp. RDE2]
MSDNVIDIITRQVIEKVGDEIESRTQAAVRSVVEQAQKELVELVGASTPPPQEPVPSVIVGAGGGGGSSSFPSVSVPQFSAKADAKDRAWRTLVQGIVVTVILAVITAFGAAVAAPDFDLLTWDSWKAAATAGGTAAVMAIVAYFQRLLNPPRNGG